MLVNPVMSSSVVSKFNFRGCAVTVESVNYRSTDLANAIQMLRNDSRLINQIQRKYNLRSSGVGARLNQFRGYMRNQRYRLILSMGGLTNSFETATLFGADFNAQLKRFRKRQVDQLRSLRNRYSRAQTVSVRPSSVSYRYSGTISHYFNKIGSHRVGYVNSEPNQFLRLYQTRLSSRLFEAVRPMTSERHVGIEIECGINVNHERLGYLLRPFAGYVMIKHDGSVHVSNRTSVELNICAPISKYKEILAGVTSVLNSTEVAARVNKTCGLHVHLDVREWRNDFNALSDKYARLISVQGILYSMQPRSRQDNTYCQKSKSRSIVRGASRYQGINAQSIWKYTTIETRLHAGTTDYTKIVNWCDLLIGVMYSTGTVPKRALTKIESVGKYFPIPSSIVAYIANRVRQFASGLAEESESEAA